MLRSELIEHLIVAAAKKEGFSLNGQDRLIIRTKLAATLAGKDRHSHIMNSAPYHWRKPTPPKR
ncbi:hypothetical protein BOM23_19230 [Erwinia sp. OLMDLW33]|nr:hypothetical protein BOM23_19230 [Erwinia sp. OLMDLW33]